ncbi:MAG: S1C family serine protease [Chloroflexota bacterium]
MSHNIHKFLQSVVAGAILVAVGFAIGTAVLSSTAFDNATTVNTSDAPTFSVRTAYSPPDAAAISVPQESQRAANLSETDRARVELYNRVAPSVVSITVVRASAFTNNEVGASGSGFVIDQQGHIVSNYHVVQDASEIIVNFFDGTLTRADIVGLDPDSDLAVIRVDLPEDRLFPVTFGDVEALEIGERVAAIGSPFGQNWTFTVGIISAKNRSIRGLGDYSIGSAIQTDTPINPGNSGGPLLNMAGEVIGVNSQILSETRANAGVGFAVPADLVVRVAEELIEDGDVDYSYIGIAGNDITIDVIEDLDLPNNQRGIVVGEVVAGSPADDAGIRSIQISGQGPSAEIATADIIVAVDGMSIDGFPSLISYLARNTRPGDTVTLTILRDGERIDINVTLGDRDDF